MNDSEACAIALDERSKETTTMPKITRAISIRQPYVELILRKKKKHEYRSTPTRIKERVYLYAGCKPADDARSWSLAKGRPGQFPVGAIVGTVEIVWCRWSGRDNCYKYRLENPERLRRKLVPKNQPQPKFFRPRF